MNVQNLKMHFNNNANQTSQVDNKISQKTHIPIARFGMRNSVENVFNVGNSDKWKIKYEESEKTGNKYLIQIQRNAKYIDEISHKNEMLQKEIEVCKNQLLEKDAKLEQLKKLSEGVYKEYDQLRNRYELESGTMEQVMRTASQWYKQNRELKRRSTALIQRVIQVAPESISDLNDETDASTCSDDLDELRQTVHDLNHQVACLQAELNAALQQEFDAQESIIELTTSLETERNACMRAVSELQEMKLTKESLEKVQRMFASEMLSLRQQCTKEKEVAMQMKSDADQAKKERNVLAHQSQLLMCEVATDERLMQLMTELENLKRTQESEKQAYLSQIQELQEKIEEGEQNSKIDLLEEKLKLAESELQCAIQRAERTEVYNRQLSDKITKIEIELETYQKKSSEVKGPPPPPPLPEFLLSPSLTRNIHNPRRSSSCGEAGSCSSSSSAVLEMANLLGIPRKTSKPPLQNDMIDDIINEIKGGRYALKSVEKPKVNRTVEQAPAIQEFLLTMRRRRNPNILKNEEKPPADVAL